NWEALADCPGFSTRTFFALGAPIWRIPTLFSAGGVPGAAKPSIRTNRTSCETAGDAHVTEMIPTPVVARPSRRTFVQLDRISLPFLRAPPGSRVGASLPSPDVVPPDVASRDRTPAPPAGHA